MSRKYTPYYKRTAYSSRHSTSSRFAATTDTLEDVLKSQTVGLVHLSEFKKRRVELLEQKEREAAERGQKSVNGVKVGTSVDSTEPAKKKKKVGIQKGKLSFAGDEEDETESTTEREKSVTPLNPDGTSRGETPPRASKETSVAVEDKLTTITSSSSTPVLSTTSPDPQSSSSSSSLVQQKKPRHNPNINHPPPKALTKSTLLREAREREILRREFLALQERVKNEEIIIPFVFYDGTNVTPRDIGVKVKKGEAVWLFLERARRISGRREWYRVSVDDLLLVRGEVIIPHHYEFYYFIVNKTEGPNGLLFDYKSRDENDPNKDKPVVGTEDPTMTKVVDRRWYERNKHIFPASVWTEFDPARNYQGMVRRDRDNNAFFFG